MGRDVTGTSRAGTSRAGTSAADRAAWIEHRRGDRELLGWIVPEGEDFAVVDLLGRRVAGPVDWLAAEELLEELGIGYLADPYELVLETGTALRVRITEVGVDGIRVKKDDFGAVDAPALYYDLPFPAPDTLRRPEPGTDAFTLGPLS